MTTYQGFDVLDIYPDREFDDSERIDNFAQLVESKAGKFSLFYDTITHPWSRRFHWSCMSRAELINVQSFLDSRLGMYRPFWVPTWVSDFEMAEDAVAASTVIVVKNTKKPLLREYLALITPTAMELVKVGTLSAGLTSETLHLNLFSPLLTDKARRTTLISYLQFVHLSDDEVDIVFHNLTQCSIALDYTELIGVVP